MRLIARYFTALLTIAVSEAGQPLSPQLLIPRAGKPSILESVEGGAAITGFRQRDPRDGAPVSQDTTAYLSYDDNNLYVAFVCRDNPAEVRANFAKRDDVLDNDLVGIYLDTFHDRQRAYFFFANPLGIQVDGIRTEGKDDDLSFDPLWHAEGRRTEDGFIVRMEIPFKSLRFPSASRQVWGVALNRVIARKGEDAYWPRITNSVEGFVSQFASLEGLEKVPPGRNLRLMPYGFLSRGRFLDERKGKFRSQAEQRGGLDAKFVLRDAFTLDVTANPDFSLVESDEPQVTVNQRYEVFFPEKRPFFTENAAFFDTPEILFFSRRIVEPQSGVRLTGKVGQWAIGALAMNDRAPGRQVSDADPSYGAAAPVSVVRVQREFGGSTAGCLITDRRFGSTWNRVFSLDTRLKIHPNWVFTGQAIRSRSRTEEMDQLPGEAYYATLYHAGRHFTYFGKYVDRGENFRADLGFVPRVGIRQTRQLAQYNWRPERSALLSVGPELDSEITWDRQGRMQDRSVTPGFRVSLVRRTELFVNHAASFELYERQAFRKNNTSTSFQTDALKWLGISAAISQGTNINYTPGQSLSPFLADSRSGEFRLRLRAGARLRTESSYLHNRLATRGSTEGYQRRSIFNNHILRSKVNYHFDRRLSLRAIVDYGAVLPDHELASLHRDKHLTGDVLLTYQSLTGTALHIGYTNRLENLALEPTTPAAVRRIPSPMISTGHQVFVRLSYLFRI